MTDYPDWETPKANAQQMLSGAVGVTTDIATQMLSGNVGVTTDIATQMLSGHVGVTTDVAKQFKSSGGQGVTTEIASWLSTGTANGTPLDLPTHTALQMKATNQGVTTEIATEMLSGNVGVTTDIATQMLSGHVGVTTDVATQFKAAHQGVTTEIASEFKQGGQGVTTEIAALIATGSTSGTPGGVPLLGNSALLVNQGNTLLTAAGSTTLGPYTVTGVSYEILVGIQQLAAASYGNPVGVTLNWFDSGTGVQTRSKTWWVPGVSTGFQTYTGYGTPKGDEVEIVFANSDATNNARFEVTLIQGSRVYTRDDDMESLTFSTPVGGSKPNADIAAGILAESAISTPTGTGNNRNLPLYNGTATASWSSGSGAADFFLTILAVDPNLPTADQTIYHAETNSSGYNNANGIPMTRAAGYYITQNLNAATQTLTAVIAAQRQPL